MNKSESKRSAAQNRARSAVKIPVSYTHLDVYKRQGRPARFRSASSRFRPARVRMMMSSMRRRSAEVARKMCIRDSLGESGFKIIVHDGG